MRQTKELDVKLPVLANVGQEQEEFMKGRHTTRVLI